MPIDWYDGVSLTAEAALSAATGETPALNANPHFEADLNDWVAGGAGTTIARSTAQAHQGVASMLITPPGGVATVGAQTVTRYPVAPNTSYTASGWVFLPTAWADVRTCIDWYNASKVFISSGLGVASSVPAGVWTYLSQTLTAPATAAFAVLRVRLGGTPPSTVITYADEVKLLPPPTGYGAWDAGRWDAVTWGPDEQFEDISTYLRWFRSDRKFGSEVLNWDAGSAEFGLSDRDGRFNPDNLAGPYVVAGITAIRPWQPFRLRATYDGVTYDIYRGYGLDPKETWLPGHADAYVTWPCTDEWGALAEVDGAVVTPVGAGELSGYRVHRILNAAGHTGPRDVMPGRVTMLPTDLSKNTVSELKVVVDSEGGGLFVDADGTVVYEDQYALMEQSRSNTIQATFGDGSGPELPCSDVTPEYTGSRIKNIVAYQRVGGAVQTVADSTSRALYRDKRQTRTDLVCETDAQALSLATFDLEKYRQPAKRFSRIEVKPRANPALLFPKVLGLRVRDLIRVVARPLGSPPVIRDCHIAGIHHEITRDNWVTTFDLWDASIYQTYSQSRWDVGRWDEAAWFF